MVEVSDKGVQKTKGVRGTGVKCPIEKGTKNKNFKSSPITCLNRGSVMKKEKSPS